MGGWSGRLNQEGGQMYSLKRCIFQSTSKYGGDAGVTVAARSFHHRGTRTENRREPPPPRN